MWKLVLGLICATRLYGADAPTGATIVRCGKLLDVASGNYVHDAAVLINGERIAQVGPATSVSSTGARVIDLSSKTCLPGLIDVHDHLTSDARVHGYQGLSISVPRATLTGARNARITLLAGFTTVRNVGAKGFADVALRDAINAGDVDGPRLLVSGPPLSITGGHCDANLLPYEYHDTGQGVADGPWAARAKVRENIKYGADLIKVCASGGVMSKGDLPGAPQYTLEELKAIAEEAHKLGRKVAAHAHGAQSIKDSILAGIDSIEHSSLIDEEGLRLAKERGTFLVFDIYNDDYILQEGAKTGMLPESIEKERTIGRTQRENFRKAVLAGERLAFGTDGGVYPHGDNWKQFPYMVEFGMKPIAAIRAATTEAADLLGMKDQVGIVKQGAYADLIAVDSDPLQDIRTLGSITFVMKSGRVYRQ
jgi:imidazolonepropionase-like amidohydrolase